MIYQIVHIAFFHFQADKEDERFKTKKGNEAIA